MGTTLEGKVALITGAGSGIGRGVAERLAADGADIAVTDMDLEGAQQTAEAVRGLGRKAEVIKLNAASEQQIEEGFSHAVSALGGIDIVVANAGIARAGTILEMSLKDWQDQVDVNLTGVFLTVREAARKMSAAKRGGRIVCISSLAAVNTGARMWSYSATKVGVRMMVRGWAQELGDLGITVNAIGPGVIDTPLAAMLAGEEGSEIRKAVEGNTPAGRVGRPSDIGGLVSFLCSPDGEFMTGSYLLMDGGLRDAGSAQRGNMDPEDPRAAEYVSLMQSGVQRTQRLQKLLDER